MATRQKEDDQEVAKTSSTTVGFPGNVVERYRMIKEHAETYPYVWGSYVFVYGGLGAWFAFRVWKLRRTEDRVRVLQEKLCKIVENEQPPPPPPPPSSVADKAAAPPPPPPPVDKSPK